MLSKNEKRALLAGTLLALGGMPAWAQAVGEARGTGLKPATPEQLERLFKEGKEIREVLPNRLGLERMNERRRAKGLRALRESAAVPMGQETLGAGDMAPSAAQRFSGGALPARVDNSQLDFFPPIRSQGSIGSCVGWATTYYQFTHNTALQNGWDAKHSADNSRIFSPKWTYNFVNYGVDAGAYFGDAFNVLSRHGAAPWATIPYDSNYTAWPMNPTVWRNAINLRANPVQYITSVNLPENLQRVKELLANGYVLTFGTYINSWQTTSIKNDPATPEDDALAGKTVAYRLNGTNGSHAMTIVGFDDTLWTDINGNGVVDDGEKGALRIANSWGTGWGEAGFRWLAYDAIKPTSGVSGVSNTGRVAAFHSNLVYHFTVKAAYTPRVLAELTVNHLRRNQLFVSLGTSDVGATTPALNWYPEVLLNSGGPLAFNGSSTTAVDGTFVLDFSDIAPTALEGKRYHLRIQDSAAGDAALLKAFRIIDLTNGGASVASAGVPLTVDGSTSFATIDYAMSNRPPLLANATPVGPLKLGPGETVLLQADASDADLDPVTFAWTVDGVPVVGSGGAYSYAPQAAGPHSVLLEAADGRGGLSRQVWGVVRNSKPLANSPSLTIIEDTPTLIPLTAFDADSDPLTFTLVDAPAHGTLSGSLPSPVYTAEALYAGSDSFTFRVNDGSEDSPLAAVTLTVNQVNDPPVVRITSPASGASYPAPGAVSFTVDASDEETSVARVELYQGGVKVAEDFSAPFEFSVTGLVAGTYSFTAKAYDATDVVTTSSAVSVSVLAPTVSVSLADGTAAEPSSDTGRFTLSRSGGVSGQVLTVGYTLTGTAVNGTDYVSIPGTVTMAAGVTSVSVNVTPLDDALVEGKETVVLTVNADPTYKLGSTTSGTGVLLDNELPVVTMSVADAYASEPGAADTARFNVTRTGATTAPLTVAYALSGTSVAGEDYAVLPGTVVIPAGAATATVTLTALDDALVEGKETVVFTLVEDPAYQVHSYASGTAYVLDDELPVVSVTATDAEAAEPANPGTFTFARTGPTTDALTVLLTGGGTATLKSDYESLATSVVIPAGASSVVVTVQPVDDRVTEGKETVTATLAADPAYQLATATAATVNIFDDEKPELRLSATDTSASEAGPDNGAFTLIAIPAPNQDLTVAFTVGGTAVGGTDYTALGTSLTLPAGVASLVVPVVPVDDLTGEVQETVTMALTAQTAYQVGSPSSGTVNLVDNEPAVSMSASDSSAAEPGTNPGRFTVTRSGGVLAEPLTVSLSIGGTATNAVDYVELPTSVTIPASATSVNIALTPLDDTTPEGTETVVLTVVAGTGYRVSTASATVNLADNE
ncbi:Calx-beta domain-containing protein [Myxococcaceae bacterium GXIMD 01537]